MTRKRRGVYSICMKPAMGCTGRMTETDEGRTQGPGESEANWGHGKLKYSVLRSAYVYSA
jgi:hypothetical protein